MRGTSLLALAAAVAGVAGLVSGCSGGRSHLAYKELADPDPQVRADAALRLGDAKAEKAVDSLVEVLKDPDETVRMQAALALGNIGERRAVPALLDLTGDPLPSVRLAAVQATLLFRDPRAVPVLARLLYDPSETVRLHSARALAEIPSPEAMDVLVREALQDENEHVRQIVMVAMGQRGLRDAVPKLEAMMQAESDKLRARAASILRDLADASSVPALIRALDDPFYKVRGLSAHALGKISPGDPVVRAELAKRFVTETNQVTKVDLAWNLVRCGDRSGLLTIRDLLFTGQPEDVRAEAAMALGDVGEASDLHLLERAMADKKGLVSAQAGRAHEALKKKSGAS